MSDSTLYYDSDLASLRAELAEAKREVTDKIKIINILNQNQNEYAVEVSALRAQLAASEARADEAYRRMDESTMRFLASEAGRIKAESEEELAPWESLWNERESDLHKLLDRLGFPRSKHGIENACDGSYARIENHAESLRKKLAASEAARLKAEAACAEMPDGIKQSCSRLTEQWLFPTVMYEDEAEAINKAKIILSKAILRICIPPNPGSNLLERLKAADAVRNYADHKLGCGMRKSQVRQGDECTCGFYEVTGAYGSLRGDA